VSELAEEWEGKGSEGIAWRLRQSYAVLKHTRSIAHRMDDWYAATTLLEVSDAPAFGAVPITYLEVE
jgi:hypothetical protein